MRIGYEFNGNNYPTGAYKAAYQAVVQAWRADERVSGRVAGIWDFVCSDAENYMDWYPGDDVVDWWGIFSVAAAARIPLV